jgi:hypothetical protein
LRAGMGQVFCSLVFDDQHSKSSLTGG